jgi:non-specific serine/threonine protein kinase
MITLLLRQQPAPVLPLPMSVANHRATPAGVAQQSQALPPGTRLGEFEVVSLLGVGGFGMVYQAFDHQLQRFVAIKEYMPAALAGRADGHSLWVRPAW